MRCNYKNLMSDEIGLAEAKARTIMGLLNQVRGAAGGAVEKAVKEANAILKRAGVHATIRIKNSGGFQIVPDPDKAELDLADEDGPGDEEEGDEDDEDDDDGEWEDDDDYSDDDDSDDDDDEEDDPRDVALVARIVKRWGVSEGKAWKLLERATDKIEDEDKEPTGERVLAKIGTWLDKWAKENGKGEVGGERTRDEGRKRSINRGGSDLTPHGLETAAMAARKFDLDTEEAIGMVKKAIRAISSDTSRSEEGEIPGRENILEWIGRQTKKGGGRGRDSKRGRRSAA